MSYVQKLQKKGLIKPPPFVLGGIQYETIMGSEAYGVSSNTSDRDIYGFCIPPKDVVFVHLQGVIPGFGKQPKAFNQWEQHRVLDKSDKVEGEPREYDFSIYNIVRYFQLCMENNPNMIDSLFTPTRCVLHSTKIADMVRDRRKSFLHKGAWHKYKGYAFSQMKKIRNKDMAKYVELCRHFDLDPMTLTSNTMIAGPPPQWGAGKGKRGQRGVTPDAWQDLHDLVQAADGRGGWGNRLLCVEETAYDIKFAYHVVRLLDEADQILTVGDIDLTRDRERLKTIRRGEWTLQQIEDHFAAKERALEEQYTKSDLPDRPDEKAIKRLLLDCLEEYYGDLSSAVVQPDRAIEALRRIGVELESVRGLL